MNRIVRHAVLLICYGLIFTILGGVSVYVYLSTRFAVEPWHEVNLKEEFMEASIKSVPDFESYKKLEERLFKELSEKVYQTTSGPGSLFNRYASGSLPTLLGMRLTGTGPSNSRLIIPAAATRFSGLSLVTNAAKSSMPSLGYTGAYAFANVLLTVAGSIILFF